MSEIDLRTELSSVAKGGMSRQPQEGDVWRLCPLTANAGIYWYDEGGAEQRSGHLIEDRVLNAASNAAPAMTEWVKVHLFANTLSVGLRPGFLLGGDIFRIGQCAVVPGFTQKPKHRYPDLPELVIDYPAKSPIEKEWVRYHFWAIWGVQSTPGHELLAYVDHMDAGSISNIEQNSAATPLSLARSLLSQLLGLKQPSWIPPTKLSEIQGKATFRRGEYVRVRFRPDRPPVPCLVISDNALNGSACNNVVVLRTLPFKQHHARARSVIPLVVADSGWSSDDPRTLDLTLIRSIGTLGGRSLVSSYSPPRHMPETFLKSSVQPTLEALYGCA